MSTQFTKRKISYLGIALSSLLITGLSTGSAEATWIGARCKVQCSKSYLANSDKKLNDCAANCDNTKLIDLLYNNYYRLNPSNVEHFLEALKYQRSLKQREHTSNENKLMAELAKPAKKQSKSTVNKLRKVNDQLTSEIEELRTQIEKISSHNNIIKGVPNRRSTGAPSPTSTVGEEPMSPMEEAERHEEAEGAMSRREEAEAAEQPTHSGSVAKPLPTPHKGYQVPTYPHPSEVGPHHEPSDIAPPQDLPPTPPEDLTPMPISQPGHNPPPQFGKSPREMLKAELKAQNPNSTPFQIDTMLQNMLDQRYPGASKAEVAQRLRADHEAILEEIKAGGTNPSVGTSAAVKTSETVQTAPTQAQRRTMPPQPQGGLGSVLGEMGANPQERLRKTGESPRPTAQPQGGLMGHLAQNLDKRRQVIGDEKDNPDGNDEWPD